MKKSELIQLIENKVKSKLSEIASTSFNEINDSVDEKKQNELLKIAESIVIDLIDDYEDITKAELITYFSELLLNKVINKFYN
jgi:tRNA A37 threonylcarbamoyladenosine dehydratase